jgi:hypothetical protein
MNNNLKARQRKKFRYYGMQCILYGMSIFILFIQSCIGPTNPEDTVTALSGGYSIISQFQTTGYALDVVATDSFAFVAQGQAGVAIINICNPQKPILESELLNEIPGYSTKVAYLKDSIGNEVVYSVNGVYGVATIDVKNKKKPTVPRPTSDFKQTVGIFIYKNFLFCSDSIMDVGVGDISNPKFPKGIWDLELPGYSRNTCVSSDSNYLMCALGEYGLALINISKLVTGVEFPDTCSGQFNLPGITEDVAIMRGTKNAFLACGLSGLQIIDYSDTAHLKLVGSFQTGGYAREVIVDDKKAYLATEKSGIQIIDISNVSSPKRIGIIKINDVRGITVSNGYVFAADRYAGLVIIKIP